MKDMSWKIIKSEQLFNDLWFKVRKDTCQQPSGKIVDPYYVYEFPHWVTAVAVTKEGKIILERQYRHALQETAWEIPGGCVDDTDADFQSAIQRELLEETGYEFQEYHYLGKTSANPSTNSNWMHMFLATGGELKYQQSLDENEDIEVHLFTVDEVKSKLKAGEIIQSMHVTCLFYALEKLGSLKY